MEVISKKPAKRAAEPIDEWLQSEGFFRKHAPKDPTCLFRAVSEQVYLTQHFHIRVRGECVEFMRKNCHLFEKNISVPFENYLEQMACFTEWGGRNEIEAMSLLYERNVILFDGLTLTKNSITNHDFNKLIYLCHSSQKQYESVYTQDYISSAAFCQSLVYQTLYKDVFKMPNVDDTVYKMLHDRSHSYRHDKFFSKANLENRETLTTELLNKMEEGCPESEEMRMINKGFTPFPYRVAKALDPNIFRNTDFDIWHEIRREVRNAGFSKYNGTEFQVGGKCLVELHSQEDDVANNNDLDSAIDDKFEINDGKTSADLGKREPILLTGHIQEMEKNEGPVIVFILELGEKRTVPYSALKPVTSKKVKATGALTTSKKNPPNEQSPKFKKSWGPSSRKGKDQSINGNNCSPPSYERNANKITHNKKNDNGFKWVNESCESKSTFGKQCDEKFQPNEDFTNDDFFEETEKNEDDLKKFCPQSTISTNGSEVNFQVQSQQQGTTYFLPPAENNNYPIIPYCGNFDMLPNLGYLLDQAVQPINLGASKSIDINGSDLPFSDLSTLRFFYNLGLQYFHAVNSWTCGPNQPLVNGQYIAPDNCGGQKPNNTLGPQVIQEDVMQTPNMQQKCAFQLKKENVDNGRRGAPTQKPVKNVNTRFNGSQEQPPMQNCQSLKNNKDYNKSVQYPNERVKDQINVLRDAQRNPRNGLAPRFKKSVDGRNRNFVQPSRRNHQREFDFYQGNNRFSGSKMEGQGKQLERNGGMSGNRQNHFPNQVPMPINHPPFQYLPNQPGNFPQPICNEAETYCPPSPGLIQVPYMHQVESGDNNANPFPPVVYTGIDNYPQAYVPYYPPYTYPPQAVFSGVPPSNAQENWYQYPGHSHFIPSCVPYNPCPAVTTNGAV